MPAPGKLILYDIGVYWSGIPAHARLWMNAENRPSGSSFSKLSFSDVSLSIAQQQLFILWGLLLHSQVWDSNCNAVLFPLITVLKHGVKRLTSRHIDTTTLTKVEENMNLVAVDNCNLSFIIIIMSQRNAGVVNGYYKLELYLTEPFILKSWSLLFYTGVVKK